MTPRVCILAATLVVVMAIVAAGSEQQAPVFKSGVDLVALDVTVVDKDGKPIEGLKAADFVVTLNGKPGIVRQMDYLTYGGAPSSEVTVAARETSNVAPAAAKASRGGRVIVLLIDDLAAKVTEGKMLLIAAERILNTLDLGDMVGLATTSGLGPVISPTRDRAAVLAVLKSRGVLGRKEDITAPFMITVPEALDFERGMNIYGSSSAFIRRECAIAGFGEGCGEMVGSAARRLARDTLHRSAMQLRAYAEVIAALKPAPDPRIVIALSTGVAPAADDYVGLAPVARAAAEAGVRFYALTEVGDMADVSMAGAPGLLPQDDRPYARKFENSFLTAGVQTVAAAAGGEAWRVVGQADRFFKRIISETSGVYRLGVETTASIATSRLLDAKVSVKRAGVTVRANRHAVMPSAAAAPVDIDAALRTRLASGGVAFGVPIALATSVRRDPAGVELQLGVNIQMPANVAAPLVAMFAIVDQAGKIVNAGRQPVPSAEAGEDYQLAFPIGVAPGAYRLRFAVADAAGNIGSVEQSVDARLARLGAVSVSDLVTTWSDADGKRRFLALETVPATATSMRAFLELYQEAGSPSLEVRFVVLKAGESAAVLEETRTPLPEGTALAAGIDIPVGTLGSGSYTLRATVVEAGVETGTVTTSFRKQ
jgi:VWFA-related protein